MFATLDWQGFPKHDTNNINHKIFLMINKNLIEIKTFVVWNISNKDKNHKPFTLTNITKHISLKENHNIIYS